MDEKLSKVYEEVETLKMQNSALNEEINELHLLLLELGDPDEKPHPKMILRGDTWIVEGHEKTEHQLVVSCSKEENVEIVKCDGGDEYFCIRIQPIAGKVRRRRFQLHGLEFLPTSLPGACRELQEAQGRMQAV
eukprot:766693-Hanusia_phi.AAC.4